MKRGVYYELKYKEKAQREFEISEKNCQILLDWNLIK